MDDLLRGCVGCILVREGAAPRGEGLGEEMRDDLVELTKASAYQRVPGCGIAIQRRD